MKKILIVLATSLCFTLISLGILHNPLFQSPTATIAHADAGDVYCVVPANGTPGPFSNCTRVFTGVQTAVDTAVGGEEIRVASGVYTDIHQQAGITQVVYIDKSLTLRGGYNNDFGTFGSLNGPSILDAQGRGRVIYITGDITVTVERFDITGGEASKSGNKGGGIFVSTATVFIKDSKIYSNIASSAMDTGFGGGLSIQESDVKLDNISFLDNVASYKGGGEGVGGAIAVSESVFEMSHSLVQNNTACISSLISGCVLTVGGGLSIVSNKTVTLHANIIISNTGAISGHPSNNYTIVFGGGMVIGGGKSTLSDNIIQGNIATLEANTGYGGGIFLEDITSITLTNNLIQNNLSNYFGAVGYGGGIYNDLYNRISSTLKINQNIIQNNKSNVFGSGLGGGAFLGNNLSDPESRIAVWLSSNSFLSNTASITEGLSLGGGSLFVGADVMLKNNLFQGNSAFYAGGAIYQSFSSGVYSNTVIVDNQANFGGAGLFLESKSYADLAHSTISRNGGSSAIHLDLEDQSFNLLAMTNTIIASHATGITVNSNNTVTLNGILWHNTPITLTAEPSTTISVNNQFTGDPRFAADGYHLRSGSAAIGQGLEVGVRRDIDSQPRRSPPDLGADEYWFGQWHLPLILKNYTSLYRVSKVRQ